MNKQIKLNDIVQIKEDIFDFDDRQGWIGKVLKVDENRAYILFEDKTADWYGLGALDLLTSEIMNKEMRLIKFRAWDSKNKRMYYQGEPDLETIQSFFFHHNENDNLMQFTGLYDKNGKEIYEGDIIQLLDSKKKTAVTFVKGCFYTKFKDCNYRLGGWEKQSFEVIGNIYENEEL